MKKSEKTMLSKKDKSGNLLTAKKTAVFALTFLMMAAMIAPAALATDQTRSSLQSASTIHWKDEAYAYADGGGAAYATNPTQNATYYGYGFSLPAGSAIEGMTVRLDAWVIGTGNGYFSVELSQDGGNTWTNAKSVPGAGFLTLAEASYFAGGSSDTWGTSGDVSKINTDDFRVRVTAQKDGGNVENWYLDWLSVTITYSTDPVDASAPLVTVTVPAADGLNGWFVSKPVSVSITAADSANVAAILVNGVELTTGLTGIGTPSASATYAVSDEGVSSITVTARDGLGNTGAAAGSTNAADVRIDTVAPSMSLNMPPGPYVLNQPDLTATWTASDPIPGSGLASPASGSFTIDTSAIGSKSYSVVAPSDVAGNVGAGAADSYQVVYSTLYGHKILQPLEQVNDPDELTRVHKAGSTLPVKFQLCDYYGEPVGPASTLLTLKVTYLGESGELTGEKVTVDASGASNDGNVFRFGSDAKQYIFNLSTKGYESGIYRITVALDDDSKIVTYFQLKK